MDIIKSRSKNYATLHTTVSHYIKKVEYVYPHLYHIVAQVKKFLTGVKQSIVKLDKLRVVDVESVFQCAYHIHLVDDAFLSISELLTIDDSEKTEMSNTAVLDVKSDFIKLGVKLNMTGAEDIYKFLSEMIKNDTLDVVNAMFNKYNTIVLYGRYIQHSLNTADPSSRLYIQLLESLESTKLKSLKSLNTPIIPIRMQRFGMIPLWQDRSVDQVLGIALYIIKNSEPRNPGRMYGGGKKQYDAANLQKLSNVFREKKRGLFIIASITDNPIAFDIEPLVRKKVADTLNTPPDSGVTADVLKKFKTIKQLSSIHAPTFKDFTMGDIRSDKWLVLRTLNGENYDILGLDIKDPFVNKKFIDTITRGASPLISAWTDICCEHISQHLVPVKEVALTAITPLQTIAAKVSQAINVYVDKELKTPPTTMSALYEIISGDMIEDITSKLIIESYEGFADGMGEELSSTFLFNADAIIAIFIKLIREDFAKSRINEIMFREKTEASFVVYIRTIIVKIIKTAAEKTFDPQKDIYEKLLIKKILLNTVG